jgi:hypothetical protein
MEDYAAYSALDGLEKLVRAQQRLVRQIVLLEPLALEEKQKRQEIAEALRAAQIPPGDGVTCIGYDVLLIERRGTIRLNEERHVSYLVAEGLTDDRARELLALSQDVGEPSSWATVKASKGSKVRRP